MTTLTGTLTSTYTPLMCDICDLLILKEEDLCTLYIQGIQEKLSCHPSCIKKFFSCKGEFTKLPNGRVKRAILSALGSEILIKNTGITLTAKKIHYIKDSLRKSHEDGMRKINNMAVDFYNLPKPSAENHEYYTIDKTGQLVLARKNINKTSYKIVEATRS